jgi:hypothetical protein
MVNDNKRVTKTNFFNTEANERTQAEQELVELNESMISCAVDPELWMKEVERVQNDLTAFYVKLDKENTDPLSNCLKQAKEAKEKLTKELRNKINKLIEFVDSELYYISKEENRMNNK